MDGSQSTTSSSSEDQILPRSCIGVIYDSISNGFSKVQGYIIGGMDWFFYHHGKQVAKYPYWYIALCLVITGLCGIGLIKFREENNIIKLWIPEDSSQRVNTDWLWDNFPNERRYASMIFIADNILVPEVIQAIYKVHKSIEELVTPDGDTWDEMCEKVPVVRPPRLSSVLFSEDETKRRRRDTEPFTQNNQLNQLIVSNSENLFDDFTIQPEVEPEISNDDFVGETTTENFFQFDNSEFSFGTEPNDYDNQNYNDPWEGVNETNAEDKALHYSLNLYPDPFCKMVSQMPSACLEWSILELWANEGVYDEDTDMEISNLTQEAILYKINNVRRSGVFLLDKSFSDYLGEVTYNDDGEIIGAKATIVRWFGKLNATEALLNPVNERDEPIDRRTLNFEGEMIKILLNKTDYPEGLESFPNVQRSFGDVAISTILGDIWFLAAGFAIVFIYIMLMLGKFGWVEHRVFLALAGIISVVMGIIVAYGFCSAMGLFFGPMHNILPFLLLGIGIDDMFVIVQSWDTLTEQDHREKSLVERFGIVMMHSGVAISITSITDVAAFALGGVTILPALKSFCFYSSVGIVSIYWFICTFFVALMTLDQRRIEDHRDGLWPCYKHKNYKPNSLVERSLSKAAFEHYGNFLMKTPVKILVIVITMAITGVAIWGNLLLEQKFVPAWFLPPDSYLFKWFEANQQYFPFGGDRVTVWCAGLDYEHEMEKINNLALTLKNQTDIIDNVDAWTMEYLDYIQLPSASLSSWDGDFDQFTNDSYFYHKLTQFIYSPRGAKYQPQFKFEFEPWCGYSAPNVYMTDMTFTHKVFDGPSQHIPAMNRVKKIIADANLTGMVFPLSQGYAAWETDEVIAYELYRNLGLAILCIFITTIIFIGHLICSLLVLFMVVLSLINVAGFIHFWGLTIDTVSCVNLIIAIGLCVDYSAHIAHRFLVEQKGNREDRVKSTLTNIGPAVMNGGLSTFIAFILLANSKSHVFITFFKIFMLVVVFGLFHGLTLLPVILSWIGPRPNAVLKTKEDNSISSDSSSNDNPDDDTTYKKNTDFQVTFTSVEHLSPKSV